MNVGSNLNRPFSGLEGKRTLQSARWRRSFRANCTARRNIPQSASAATFRSWATDDLYQVFTTSSTSDTAFETAVRISSVGSSPSVAVALPRSSAVNALQSLKDLKGTALRSILLARAAYSRRWNAHLRSRARSPNEKSCLRVLCPTTRLLQDHLRTPYRCFAIASCT